VILPDPKPGLVIRYSFLWSHERAKGLVEGSKDRPCAIVVAARKQGSDTLVMVAPITHRTPDDPAASAEIPADVCRHLRLDAGRHWIRFDQLNQFFWPGYDLRRLPNGSYGYGMLPRGLFQQLLGGILDRSKKGRQIVIPRDE